MRLFFSAALALFFFTCALYGQVRINELQAVNTSSYADMVDFEDYADWLELYNTSATRLDLSNYYLTDNLNNPVKWPFPAGASIAGNGYLVIWADQRDAGIGETHRRPYWPWTEFVTKSLHANFKLSSAGEELGLFYVAGGDTVAVDSLRFGRQAADVAWGHRADAPDQWAYFGDPTPGSANATQPSTSLQYAAAVAFSPASAFSAAAHSIVLTTPSAEIYYSTDGSKPAKGAPTSALYRGPVLIEKNTLLKARAYAADRLPGPIKTQTYFVGEELSALPTVSYAVDPDVFWDEEKGIYRNNFKGREVPVHIEFFHSDRSLAFAEQAGSRIGGLNIWRFAQKPLTIYLRDRYGADALEYPLFGPRAGGTFSRFMLRNGGDDWPATMLRDPLAEAIAEGQIKNPTLAYRPVSLFINGAYWGIHNMRERFDEQFFLSHFGVAPSQYTHIEWVAVESIQLFEDRFELAAANGSLAEYLSFESALSAVDMALASSFAAVQAAMDLDNFIDFLAVEIYAVNTSWFHNREMWKSNEAGGRWQWLLTDLDRGFSLENLNNSLFDDFKRDPVYAQLIESEAFRQRFIQRYTAHLNSTLSPRRLASMVDSLARGIAPEMVRHSARWSFQGGIASPAAWEESLRSLQSFVDQRAERCFAEVRDFFVLGEWSELEVLTNMDGAGDLYINDIRMAPGERVGRYFHAIPIEIRAVPRPGYRLVGWEGDSTAEKLVISLDGDSAVTALFEKNSASEIPAEIERRFALKKENSPYYAAGDIRVRKGAVLEVEPGVEIQMPERGSLYIEGRLEILGSEDDPVRILPNASSGAQQWGALCFVESSDTSTVRHLYLRNASRGADPLNQLAAISALNSHLVLDHIDIAAVDFPIFVRGGSVVLQNSRLHADATSDYINVKGGSALSQNNVFVGNDAPDTDGIDYDGVVDGIIRDNIFYNFAGSNSDAIDIGEQAQNILIAGNRIFNISDKGVSVGQHSTVRLENNVILECNMGIAVKDSSYAFIDKNTFYGNGIAVACFEKNIGQWGGRADVLNSILASSSQQATLVDEYSELNVRYSLANTAALAGVGNLFLDAFFKDARQYHLERRADSPAIDAGDPNSTRDRDGSVVDMGADSFVTADLWPEDITQARVPPVLINEIMYRASEDFASGDWVEFYNTTEETLSLAGWSFSDSDSTNRFEFPLATAIGPRGYLVVARAIELFQAVYPDLKNVVGNFEFGLAPEDGVKLYNAELLLVSEVAYRNAFPWPLAADGVGSSLSRNTAFLFNGHVDNWTASEQKGSPGRANSRIVEGEPGADGIHLVGNRPNPFSKETAIRYVAAESGEVKVEVYNVAGQRLIAFTRQQKAGGEGEIIWDGRDRNGQRVAAGIYLYTLSFKGEKKSARMLVLR